MDHVKSAHPTFREELGIKSPGIDSNLSMDPFITYVSASQEYSLLDAMGSKSE